MFLLDSIANLTHLPQFAIFTNPIIVHFGVLFALKQWISSSLKPTLFPGCPSLFARRQKDPGNVAALEHDTVPKVNDPYLFNFAHF